MQRRVIKSMVQRSCLLLFLMAITILLAVNCGKNGDQTDTEETKPVTTSGGGPLVEAKKCAMCGKEISGNTTCRITLEEGKELNTCCSLCTANIKKRIGGQPFNAVTVCYSTGRKVDFKKAFFVVESDEAPCCTPSVLAFVSMGEAEKFVAEKNGRILSYPEILNYAAEYKNGSK
jgi:nitrous oxide reductase accessory protein NosL